MDSIGSIRLGPTGHRETMGKLPHFPSCMVPLGLVCADDGSWIQIVWMLTLRWSENFLGAPSQTGGTNRTFAKISRKWCFNSPIGGFKFCIFLENYPLAI